MLERNVLIIDDNPQLEKIHIPVYLSTINLLKQSSAKWAKYQFNISHCTNMKAALDYLSKPNTFIDVLVVDYDFNGEQTFSNGTAFVEYIRENINRFCQIVFYTMHGISIIEPAEWVALVNSDVCKFVDKSVDDAVLGKAIFEAATKRNPIVESLERFWCKYEVLLGAYTYTFNGNAVTFDEIINHIRMDDEIGRAIVEKLLQKAVLTSTEI